MDDSQQDESSPSADGDQGGEPVSYSLRGDHPSSMEGYAQEEDVPASPAEAAAAHQAGYLDTEKVEGLPSAEEVQPYAPGESRVNSFLASSPRSCDVGGGGDRTNGYHSL